MSRDYLADTMPRPHRVRLRLPHFDFGALFGGGGGGGGGSSRFLKWYKNYILDQQADQELSEERVDEQRDTQADYRRNELADRSGYAGLVNVGSAVQETDATLAARMALLAPDDPQRATYDKAITDEATRRAGAQRIITGEQYEVEDKFKALTKNLDDDSSVEDLEKRLADLDPLAKQYDWYGDAGTIRDDLAKRLKKAQEKAARAAAAAGVVNADGGDGGGAAAGDGGGGAASS